MKQNAKIAKELIKLAKELVADYSEDDTPRVYVGTYAKYNNGNLAGEWVDLTNFSDKEDFLEYCAELHSDESDPEFMFQDYENFPREYYGQSNLESELWDYIEKIEDYDKEMVDAILEEGYELTDVDDFSFYSDCSDVGEFAVVYIDEMGGLENLGQEILERYFDYEAYGKDFESDVKMIKHNNGYLVKYY